MFEPFWGNVHIREGIGQMIAQGRLSQTLLFSGPEGVGKATLARRLGAHLLGQADLIEQDELSQAQNLETLEEPPDHLILIMTAENAYDLPPTIRSRAVPFHFAPLARAPMQQFVRERALDQPERRVALAAGSPGLAISLDLEAYDKRRAAM